VLKGGTMDTIATYLVFSFIVYGSTMVFLRILKNIIKFNKSPWWTIKEMFAELF
jgi:hypothetical protein